MDLCVDLCSGTGGFSQAFREAGWEVVTVDNDPDFQPTICADVRTLKVGEIERATSLGNFRAYRKVVALAAPPCQRFSIAMPRWPQSGIREALEIVGACLELIIEIAPDAWLMENPKGRLRWFLGAPPNSVKQGDYGRTTSIQGGKNRRPYKPTDLWGNVPFGMVPASKVLNVVRGSTGFTKESRAARSAIPIGLSRAILKAVET